MGVALQEPNSINPFARSTCDPNFSFLSQLVSSGELVDDEIKYVFDSFMKLGYSRNFIDNVHVQVRQKHYSPPTPTENDSRIDEFRNRPNISLPYNNFISKFVRPIFGSNNFGIYHKAGNTLRSKLTRNRPSSQFQDGGGAGVYTIDCGECNLKYVGQTGRGFDTRIKEHKDSFRSSYVKSATLDHSIATNHKIDFNSSKLVYKSGDLGKRLVVESSLIKTIPNFNNTQGVCSIDDLSSKIILSSSPSLANYSSI